MELTPLDTELIRLDQTLSELINLGLVQPCFYSEEDGQPTRFRLGDGAIDLSPEKPQSLLPAKGVIRNSAGTTVIGRGVRP